MEEKIIIAVGMFLSSKHISCARYCRQHGIDPRSVVDVLVLDLGYSLDAVEYFMNIGLDVVDNETTSV